LAFGKASNYKFNGAEQSVGVGLTHYEFMFRNYDPQIGRWQSLDPRPNNSLSPYVAFENNPLIFSDMLGDTIINGVKVEPVVGEVATYLENVTVVGVRKTGKFNKPTFQQNYTLNDFKGPALDVLQSASEFKVDQLRAIANDSKTKELLAKQMFRSLYAKYLLSLAQKGFAIFELVNIGLNSTNSSNPLDIPIIGGVTGMITQNLANDYNEDLFENSIRRGYLYMARFMNSATGHRFNLLGVYTTEEGFLKILENGHFYHKMPEVYDNGGSYPDQSPAGPNGEANYYKYFIFFPYEDRHKKQISTFGAIKLTGQKWGE